MPEKGVVTWRKRGFEIRTKMSGPESISIIAPASSFDFTLTAGFPELQMKSLVFIQT